VINRTQVALDALRQDWASLDELPIEVHPVYPVVLATQSGLFAP
jgi:hypothetical protein